MNVSLFGGTGHLGREVARAAARAGHRLRVVSRRPRPPAAAAPWHEADLVTGRGLVEAVAGAEAVVFAAGDAKNHEAVEVGGMRRLAGVCRAAGVGHLVYVSIVGVDRLPVAYYRTKLAAERVLAGSGLPYSILRATQFHPFVATLLVGLNRVPVVLPVPSGFRVQPVATEDVAVRLVTSLADGPKGMLADYCGPEVLLMSEAARLWRNARGSHKPVVAVPIPGATGRAFRAGHNTNPGGELGSVRWAEWLAREVGPPGRREEDGGPGCPSGAPRDAGEVGPLFGAIKDASVIGGNPDGGSVNARV